MTLNTDLMRFWIIKFIFNIKGIICFGLHKRHFRHELERKSHKEIFYLNMTLETKKFLQKFLTQL